MLRGKPLFVVQAGTNNIRKILSDGDRYKLTKIKPDTLGTAAQFIKAMAKASVLKILQIVIRSKYNELKEYSLQQAAYLDFLKTHVTSIHEEPAINPSINALNDAFN